jgi:hypothetical protein
MPQIDFTPENKRDSRAEFNFFKLKADETARVVMLEHPTYTWVHTLRAPKIISGQAVKVTKTRKNGESFVDFDVDFLGRPLCLGDFGTIADKGSDPANCPICKAVKEGGEVSAPERRFATNLIRYGLDHGGKPIIPFACTCVVWCFTEGYYDKLYKIQEEHGELRGRDLLLGPCQIPESYQRFDVNPGARSVWQLNDQIKQLVLETYRNNRAPNLEQACGRLTERRYIERDLETIEQRWAIARGGPAPDTGTALAGAEYPHLTQGLGDLLAATAAVGAAQTPPASTPTAPTAAPTGVAAPVMDLSGLLDGLGTTPAPLEAAPATTAPLDLGDLFGAPAVTADPFATATAAPASAPAPAALAAASTAEPVIDFDQLLANLK